VSGPFPSWHRSILTEIYLYHACSYGEIEDGNGPDRGNGDFRIYVGPAPKFANQASSASAAAEQRAFEGGQSQEARVRELDAARVLVSQGKGDSAMMPPGTWGMRLPLTATRLCVAAANPCCLLVHCGAGQPPVSVAWLPSASASLSEPGMAHPGLACGVGWSLGSARAERLFD
jgi:hypothetical protein